MSLPSLCSPSLYRTGKRAKFAPKSCRRIFVSESSMKEKPSGGNDPAIFQTFRDALGMRDPKTVAAYLTTMRHFVTWLASQPGGTPFHLGLVTETAVRGYLDTLKQAGRAPRTRSKALSGLRRFCQWAV